MKPSTPSSPPSPASVRAKPASGWRKPEPGDVLSYAYLWHREAARGQEEGLKDRPVVVVLATVVRDGRTQLLVAPVTHSPPDSDTAAIALPPIVKRDLGLDVGPSWIVCDELNSFAWPGPDIRSTALGDPIYGAIPAWLFARLKATIGETARRGRVKRVPRAE